MKRILLLILALLLVTGALCSCKRVEDDEALAIVKDLVDRSYVLNQIYYGDGLPHNPDEHYYGDYYYVAEDAPYNVKNDILVETKAVFSKQIADELIDIYFTGTKSYGMVVQPRYMSGATGFLTVNTKYENVVKRVYKYDTSRLEITKIKRNEIRAKVPAIVGEGEAPFEIEVFVTYDKDLGVWRLDSPTY
jgi:hypothetical protein